jgi:hypothetical protein
MIRTLPEPQFLDRPPLHQTLERGPLSSDAMRRGCRSTPDMRARLTRSRTLERDPRCSPDAAVPDLVMWVFRESNLSPRSWEGA